MGRGLHHGISSSSPGTSMISGGKFLDSTIVASVEPLNSEQRNFERQIFKLEDFLDADHKTFPSSGPDVQLPLF
ncbi:hypothetical protein Tco_0625294 [Tanacetum coccineum]|uniref:Uncharacterized protein n=1 Tax=Tanacetum coccineum TaxID=301880 RepID=A0ABQ4WGD4_9ASTR